MLSVNSISDLMKNPNPADLELLTRALAFAEEAHRGQTRFSGEPYIIHPVAVAQTLAEMNLDSQTIVAGLLHDTLEDTSVNKEQLSQAFGPTITFLVEGVTKLGELKYRGTSRHVESLRKLFVAMAEDIRVIMIRLADRLHNIRTLQYVPPDKQKRIAQETLEIYAPLANRLGMWRIKGALEDGSFPYVYPKEYRQVIALRKTKGKESVKKLEKIYRQLAKALATANINQASIDYRIKYLYSLYCKLQRKNMNIDEIYDLSALRVVVNDLPTCYQVLGIIHNLWRPVPGKLKDYISNPKPNGYQSIHTAVFTGDHGIVEIQIRSQQMQHEAEFGIASHLAYDETGKPNQGGRLTKNLKWINDLIEWQKNVRESEEFIKTLKADFFQNRIFVFTPKGDVIELPAGASALDFAFAIHSDIGQQANAARINGKYSPIDQELKNGQVVEIETRKTNHPTHKWLDIAQTTAAKKHIRYYLQANKTKK